MDAAFWSARRVTLAGSITPALTRSPNSPVSALKPKFSSLDSRTRPTTTAPSCPAFRAIWRRGSSSARFTMFTPIASSSWSLSFSRTGKQRRRATPPPETMPSSTAARVACMASSTRALPALATLVVLSLSMVSLLALPRSSIFTFSSFVPRSSVMAFPPVRMAIKLENVKIEDLGKAKKVTIDKDNTTIVAGAGKASEIEGRIKQLRVQVEETTSDYDQEKLQERLAKLVGGVAVIKVGAATETELKEKKARVEDAMHATRAAVEEGIVSGGGVALLRCLPVLEKLKLHDDEAIGVNIVKRALEEPLRQIALNAGHEGAVVVGRVRESRDENFGFNAETGEFGDLVKAGVIDPAKVTRLALQNAASIVSLMLTTEVLIAEFSGEEKMVAAGAGGGMGGSY